MRYHKQQKIHISKSLWFLQVFESLNFLVIFDNGIFWIYSFNTIKGKLSLYLPVNHTWWFCTVGILLFTAVASYTFTDKFSATCSLLYK